MNVATMRVLLTGATGGIGGASPSATEPRRGVLAGRPRCRERSTTCRDASARFGDTAGFVRPTCCCRRSRTALRGRHRAASSSAVNVLSTMPGPASSASSTPRPDADIERLFAINVARADPVDARPAAAPAAATDRGRSSTWVRCSVSLGYPGFATYSATKFALRGFTEALRRELADSNVRVLLLRTARDPHGPQSAAVDRHEHRTAASRWTAGRSSAAAFADCSRQGQCEAVLGWPEKLFVRINALLPGSSTARSGSSCLSSVDTQRRTGRACRTT